MSKYKERGTTKGEEKGAREKESVARKVEARMSEQLRVSAIVLSPGLRGAHLLGVILRRQMALSLF